MSRASQKHRRHKRRRDTERTRLARIESVLLLEAVRDRLDQRDRMRLFDLVASTSPTKMRAELRELGLYVDEAAIRTRLSERRDELRATRYARHLERIHGPTPRVSP